MRALRRRAAHVCAWPEAGDGDGGAEAWEYAGDAPAVDAGLMRDEFWRPLMAALAKLEPIPQQIFLRHHLNDEPVQDLAAAFDRTPHAIHQTLLRARKHLRAALERQGVTQSELLQYLTEVPVLHWRRPDLGRSDGRPQATKNAAKMGGEVSRVCGVRYIVGHIGPAILTQRGMLLWSPNNTRA